MSKKKSHYGKAGLVFEELEPRLLLSADPLAVATDANADTVQELVLGNNEDHTAIVQTAVEQSFSSVRSELVIIDSRAPNYQQLHNDLIKAQQQGRNIHVVVLDAHRDGIEQINEALTNHNKLDAVHIVSHGDDGQIQLGATQLDKATLRERSGDIAQWRQTFTDGGDLLIYGCDLASTADGRLLVNALGYLTATDVAASDDLTGNKLLGGDWELEYEAGDIETEVAFSDEVQQNWQGTLEGAAPGGAEQEQAAAEEQQQQAQAELDAQQAAFNEEQQKVAEQNADEQQAVVKEEQRQEVVFIDESVTDFQAFIDDLQGNSDGTTSFDIYTLDSRSDGVEYIESVLAEYDNVDAVHIYSHGDDAAVKLGSTWLNSNNLAAYSQSLNSWGSALDQEADILIYGCNLAENREGEVFVTELALLTGADVAASNDITGHASLGGDWELEYSNGSIETNVAVSEGLQNSYESVLAPPIANNDNFSMNQDQTLIVNALTENATASDLAAAWQFEEGSGTTTGDATGNGNDGTLIGGTAWTTSSRTGDAALVFDGVDDYVQTAGSSLDLSTATNFTLSGWFKTDTTAGQHHILWQGVSTENGWGSPSDNSPTSSEMHLTVGRYDINDKITFFMGYDVNDANSIDITSASNFTDTSGWHHAVVVVSDLGGGTLQADLYVDGVLEGADTGTQIDRSQWDSDMRIGSDGSASRLFDGMIDEVGIYDRALTSTEAIELYQTGVIANDTDIDADILSASLIVGPVNGAVTLTSDGSFTYTPNVGFVGTDTFTYKVNDGSLDSNTATVTIDVFDNAPVATDDPLAFDNYLTSLGPTGHWRFGEAGGGVAVDQTGLNDGTYNGPTLVQAGAISADANTALQFDGIDDYAEIAHNPAYLLDNGTVQLWFNTSDVTQRGDLFSKDALGELTGGHLSIYLDGTGNIETRLQSASASYTVNSTLPLVNGQWHHVAFTFGAGGMQLYVDGQLQDSDAYTGGLGATSGDVGNFEPIAIGASTQVSSTGFVTTLQDYYTGYMDEVALFGTALSADQILNLYAGGLQNYTVAEDNTLNVSAANGVLINDYDLEGDALTAVLVSGPSYAASFTLNPDGSFDYTPLADFSGTDTFTYMANDGSSDSNIATVTITVNGNNDAPVNTVPGTQIVLEDTQTAIAGISVADPDAGAGVISTQLSVTNGVLDVTLAGSATISAGANSSSTLTISGNVTDINATLASLQYTGNLNVNGVAADTLSIVTNDLGNTGTGGAQSDTDNVQIDITAVNDAPVARDDRIGLVFDGVDDYVRIGDYAGLNVTTNLTMEAWIKPTGLGTGSKIIINKEGEYELGITANTGEVKWAFDNIDPDWVWHNTGYFVQPDEWTHLAVTYSNGVVNTYANGVLVDTYNGSGAIADNYPAMNELQIGARQNAVTQRFDGQIDEVRVWNTTRTQLDIQNDMNSLLTGLEAGLIGNWRFDEGSGTTVVDQSALGHDGTLADSVTVAEMPSWQGYVVSEDGTLNVSAVNGVLPNDYDIDGDTLTAVLVSGPANAAAFTLNPDGSFSYTPSANFNGIDTFTYMANDGSDDSNVATVTIRVDPVNDAPQATNLSAPETYTEDTALNLTDIVVSDVDSANVTVTLTLSDVAAGSLNTATSGAVTSTFVGGVWTASGAIADVNILLAGLTFTPALNYNSNFTIATSVDDGVAPAITGTKAMTGTVVNDAPDFAIGDGTVTTDFGSGDDIGNSVVVQADGKIVVAGRSYNGSDYDFSLTRYNPDGSLDTSFNGDGKLTTDFGSGDDHSLSVSVQADGKILAAGYSFNGTNYDFALVRYNADGTLDTSFSADGMLTTAIGATGDIGYSVTLQADGKILMAGYSVSGLDKDFALVRYNTDGSLDTSFSGDGMLTTDFGSNEDIAYSVSLQTDGRILVAGQSENGGFNDIALARYNTDGSLDTSFSGDGMLTTAIGASAEVGYDVTVQPDGKILVAGFSHNGVDADFALVRYNTDGTLDTSFSADGKLTTDFGSGLDSSYDVTVQTDGKILVSGFSSNGSNYDFAVVRYNADGSLDTSFSSDGMLTTAIGSGDDIGQTIALQPDGKILVAGQSDNGVDKDIALVRYNADGTLDLTFDPVTTLDGNPTFIEDGAAVVLDVDVDVSDTELDALNSGLGNYDGASLTLVRNGGASAEDVLAFNDGNGITLSGGNLIKNSQVIASFDTTSTPGELVVNFTDANGETPTSADVDNILRQVTYVNSSDTPPASVQIDWTFNDGNTGVQGSGGALIASGSTIVNITAVNDAPLATNLNAPETYTEDTALNLTDIVVSDVDSANVTVTLTLSDITAGSLNTATSGSVTSTFAGGVWTANGAIADVNTLLAGLTFTPALNYNSNFNIATSVSDGVAPAITGSKAMTGTAVNDIPVANANTVTTAEDNAYTFSVADFTYSDVEGDSLVAARITNISLGGGTLTHSGGIAVANGNTLTAAQLNTLVYTPPASVNGLPLATFDFTVNDAGAGVMTAQMSINVTAVNTAPTATNLSAAETYTEDTALNLTDIVVSDVDSANVTVTLTLSDITAGSLNTATSGSVTSTFAGGVWTANGAIADVNTLLAGLTFTPTLNYNSNFTIATSVSDGVAPAITGSKAITGIAVNDPAVIGGVDTGVVTEDDDPDLDNLLEVSGALTIVDPDAGETVFNTGPVGGTYGVITMGAAGDWSYAANNNQAAIQGLAAGATLTDTITVSSVDGTTHDIVITIMGTNDAPVAGNDVANVNEGGSVIIGVAATDSDIDNALDLNSIIITGLPVNGTVIVNGNGTVTYTHNGSETLVDSFTYTIEDISGAVSNSATVSVSINPVNDAPLAGNDIATVAEGNAVLIDLAANDSDVDNALDLNSITIIGAPANGLLAINGNGTVTYTHNASNTTSDSFTYTISDISGAISNTATVNITVTPVNDAPTTSGISNVTVNEDSTNASIDLNTAFDDTDNLDSELAYTIVGNTNIGLFSLTGIDASSGQLTLDYAANMNGSAQISVRATDPAGLSVDTLFTVTVTPVNDAPVMQANTGMLATGVAPGAITNSELNVTDIDNASSEVTYTITTLPVNGALLLNGVAMGVNDTFTQSDIDNNLLVYQSAGAATSDQFGFAVADGSGGTLANNTFNIIVQLGDDDGDTDTGIADTESDPEEEEAQEEITEDSGGASDGAGGYGGGYVPFGGTTAPQKPSPALSIDPTPAQKQAQSVDKEEYTGTEAKVHEVTTFTGVQVKSMDALWSAIDKMKQEMGDSAEGKMSSVEIKAAAAKSSGVVLTAGVVAWILRSGALLSSLMSTIPLWKGYDPLPILAYKDDDEEVEDEIHEDKIPTSLEELKKLKKVKEKKANEVDVDSIFGGSAIRE